MTHKPCMKHYSAFTSSNLGISKRISRLYSLDWLEIPRRISEYPGGHSDLITLKGKITKRSQRHALNYFDCPEIVLTQKFDRLPNTKYF